MVDFNGIQTHGLYISVEIPQFFFFFFWGGGG